MSASSLYVRTQQSRQQSRQQKQAAAPLHMQRCGGQGGRAGAACPPHSAGGPVAADDEAFCFVLPAARQHEQAVGGAGGAAAGDVGAGGAAALGAAAHRCRGGRPGGLARRQRWAPRFVASMRPDATYGHSHPAATVGRMRSPTHDSLASIRIRRHSAARRGCARHQRPCQLSASSSGPGPGQGALTVPPCCGCAIPSPAWLGTDHQRWPSHAVDGCAAHMHVCRLRRCAEAATAATHLVAGH